MTMDVGHVCPPAPEQRRRRGRPVTLLVELVAPFVIVGALLAAAFLVHPSATGRVLPPALINQRDRFYGMAMPAGDVVWVVGGEGKILRSDDGGTSWRQQSVPAASDLQDIAAWDASRAVVVGDDGVILTTRDAGASWVSSGPSLPGAHKSKLLRVVVRAGGEAVAVGDFGTILQSFDYGAHWRMALPQRDVNLNGVAFDGGRDIMVVGEVGTVLRSTDDGASFSVLPKPTEQSLNAIAFGPDGTAIAVGLIGTVLRSNDLGAHWTPIESGTSEHLYDVEWRGASWAAAGDKGVFVTGNATGVSSLDRPGAVSSAWHTRLIVNGNGLFAAGADLGTIRNGLWHGFHY
jgi:photosystem II stability/assembly factor-like uncharacterized protein